MLPAGPISTVPLQLPLRYLVPFFLILSLAASPLRAQVDTTAADTTVAPQSAPGERSLNRDQAEVTFQASDSLVFDFRGERTGTLYGNAKVSHESGELTSGTISINLDRHLVNARTLTPLDTLSQPVLTRGEDRLRSETIAFNWETERGRFEVARVNIEEGNLIGTRVKNVSPHVVFLEDAIYSTCMLDHPHYYIKADRMKVVEEEEIFFTNARLYLLDIPYPIVFPFGYLPGRLEQRQSGLLEPTYAYQNQRSRGIGLQNLGWFQYFNDYFTAEAAVDIFTSGTYFFNTRANYRNRDSYSGSVELGYSRERGLEPTDPDFSVNTQKRLNIQHSQDFSPFARLSANIDLRTADYHRRNSYDIDERAEVSTSSNLSYQYTQPDNLYNFSISARQNRNFRTNTTRLSGPTANFSLKRISPFSDRESPGGESAWYENISFKYDNTFSSDFTFQPILGDSAETGWFEALMDPQAYREATGNTEHYRYGFRQQARLTMGQLIPSRHLNLSANSNYTEYWFPTTTRLQFDPAENEVVEERVRGFQAARDFDSNLSLSTTVYGFWNRKIGNLESFRHTVRPSLSFGYRPDFSSDFWGYYRTVQTDTTGRTREYSVFENEVFRGPSQGEQMAMGFSLNNIFEARQVERDSTGEKSENTLRLIDQLNFNSSYNFAADSLRLSDLNATFGSRVVEGLSIRANAQFNFYERDSTGRKIDRFLAGDGGRPMELVNFSLNASTSFSGGDGRGIRVNDTPWYPPNYNPLDQSIFHTIDSGFNRQPVQPFRTPWSLSVNFRYSWTLNPNGDARKSATLNAQNIQFNLTPKWNFRTRLGYDFIQEELTPAEFSLTRNLHCWNLSFTMNPFGDFQYYFFKLSVDASQIQGIFQKLPLLNNLERGSSPSGRAPRGF